MAEIVRFDIDSDQVGVFLHHEPDDEAFWSAVTIDAQEYEYDYGTDETPEVLAENGYDYDPGKVSAWVRRNVEPPKWRYHRWRDDPDDDETMYIDPAEDTDDGAFLGAIISVRAAANQADKGDHE